MSTEDLWLAFRDGIRVADCPIYDMHGHWGPFRGLHMPLAEDEAAASYLRRLGVARMIISHHASLLAPEDGNRSTLEAVRAYPDLLRGYCVVNPHYPAQTERDLAAWDERADALVGFKLHGAMHNAAMNAAGYQPAWEFAEARGLPVLVHSWRSNEVGHAQMAAIAERYPKVRLILGHSLHNDWDGAIDMAQRFPSVYLELCAVMDERGVLERFIAEVGSEQILFGTDFPWFSISYYLGAVLAACPTEDDARNILHRNAKRLLGD